MSLATLPDSRLTKYGNMLFDAVNAKELELGIDFKTVQKAGLDSLSPRHREVFAMLQIIRGVAAVLNEGGGYRSWARTQPEEFEQATELTDLNKSIYEDMMARLKDIQL